MQVVALGSPLIWVTLTSAIWMSFDVQPRVPALLGLRSQAQAPGPKGGSFAVISAEAVSASASSATEVASRNLTLRAIEPARNQEARFGVPVILLRCDMRPPVRYR